MADVFDLAQSVFVKPNQNVPLHHKKIIPKLSKN